MQRSTQLTTALIGLALAGGPLASASAEAPPRPPQQSAPQFTVPTIPEEEAQALPDADPPATGTLRREGETLSDMLDRTDGVIRPPGNIAPDMRVPAPDPDPGTTIVIPPPGTPGGDPTLRPQ